jgi:hypothetical protein
MVTPGMAGHGGDGAREIAAPDPDEIVQDFVFALNIANQASALLETGDVQ